MGFDDLLGDRQAEAGILPEALIRPVGVEALEDLIQGFRADARTVIVDHDLDLVLEPAAGDAHGAAGGGERAGIVDQIADHLAEPRVVARHLECRLLPPSKASVTLTSFGRTSLAAVTSASSSLARSTGAAS